MLENRIFALVFRILGFTSGVIGIVFQLIAGGGFMGSSTLTFFTIQTNIFTTLLFLALIIATSVQMAKHGAKGEVAHFNPSFQLALTFYITITFAVFWTILSWQNYGSSMSGWMMQTSNYLLHGVTPVLAMLDSLFFLPHGKIKKRDALIWLSYPLIYLVFVVIRGELGGPLYPMEVDGVVYQLQYPYIFLEHQIIGVPAMVGVVIGMCILFYLFGRFYIFIDRCIAKEYVKRKHIEDYYIETK